MKTYLHSLPLLNHIYRQETNENEVASLFVDIPSSQLEDYKTAERALGLVTGKQMKDLELRFQRMLEPHVAEFVGDEETLGGKFLLPLLVAPLGYGRDLVLLCCGATIEQAECTVLVLERVLEGKIEGVATL